MTALLEIRISTEQIQHGGVELEDLMTAETPFWKVYWSDGGFTTHTSEELAQSAASVLPANIHEPTALWIEAPDGRKLAIAARQPI
jgi:hypothetical protein